jgi:WD40 repeat protein
VPILGTAVSPDGALMVSGGSDGVLRLWNLSNGHLEMSLSGHTDRVNAVAFSPDGSRILSGSRDKTIKLWERKSGQELLTISGHTDWVQSVAFSPDGRLAVSGAPIERWTFGRSQLGAWWSGLWGTKTR